MSVTLFSALATISNRRGLSAGELAEAERLPSSAVTRIADRLEEDGLVIRMPNPRDRRGVNLGVTPKGQQLLDQHRAQGNAWLAGRLKNLTAEDRSKLAEALGVLEALVLEQEAPAERVAPTTFQVEPGGATTSGGDR